jgi:hypothetical protein
MVEESVGKEIIFGNENYTIYKIGEWENDYKLNVTGTSSQLPASQPTKKHVLSQMEQIRKAVFDFKGEKVNGMIGIGLQLNEDLIDMPVEDLIKLEETEYNQILDEINNLNLEDNNKFLSLETEDFLVYKLEMEHDGLKVQPATPYTLEYHLKEIEKLREKEIEKKEK